MHRGPSAPLALTVGTDRAGEGALWPRGLLQRSGWGWGAGTVREDGGHRLLQAPPHSGGWAAQPSRCFRHDLPATLSPRPGPRRPPRTSRSPRRPSEGPEGVGARHRHAAGRRRAGPPDPRGGAAGRGGEGEGSAGARAGPGPSRHLPPFPLRTVRLAQAVPRSADDTRAVPYAPTRPRQIPRDPSPRKRSRSSRAPTAYAAPRRARRAGAGPPLRPTTLCAWPRAPLPAEPGRTSRAPGAGGSALGRRCLRTCVFPRGRRGEGGAVPGRVSGPAGMSSLLAKDAYLQGLARKICSQPSLEPQKRTSASKARSSEAAGPPKKKRKTAQKKSQRREEKAVEPKSQALEKSPPASRAGKPAVAKEEEAFSSTGSPADALLTEPDSLFALEVVRQRLHEKIQEARHQGRTTELSPAALEKRRRRKQERDRKKRKRKELRAKEKVAQAAEVAELPHEPHEPPPEEAQSGLLFNKVEVTEEQASSKAQRRKEKRQKLKGNLTPLTGKNYRQLLERLQARQAQLDELRDQDEGKARELESKMKWTNLLYKAEGVRIRDNEHLLQEALKRKEKRRAQRKRKWEKRTAHVVEKMQRRQDKRRQNLRKKKAARAEQRLEKAHRKGRILPQDLERAGLA